MKIWTPYPSYEPELVERWLNEQAAGGKKLKKWGSIFVTFEEEEERGYQYCLDADDGRFEPKQERREENKEQGWEYVCSPWENIHIYRAAAGCERPADSQELKLKMNRKFRNSALINTAWQIFYPVLILGLLLPKKFIFLEFMEANWRSALFVLLFIPVIFYASVWNIRKVWKLYAWMKKGGNGAGKLLKEQENRPVVKTGEPQEKIEEKVQGTTKEKKRRIKSGQIAAVQIVFCTALILFAIGSDKKNYVNIGEVYPPVSFVDLQEISGDGFKVSEYQTQEYPGINICNSIQIKPVIFAREHYITFQDGQNQGGQSQGGQNQSGQNQNSQSQDGQNQSGLSQSSQSQDGQNHAEADSDAGSENPYASLTGTYWKMEPGLTSNTLFSQLVSRYTEYEWYRSMFRTMKKAEDGWNTELKEDPRFLKLAVAAASEEMNRRKDTTLIFAQTEEYVVYLNYSGKLAASELVEALAASLGL